MKYIILGQPRSGKSTLAKIISEEKGIPIICTDKYRREWGYHEPWKGYDTEISPSNQNKFYEKILKLYNSYENVILEGSAINPKDIGLFDYDGIVLLVRSGITAEKMLEYSRKYDNSDEWTRRRSDNYLLDLFNDYINFANKWEKENLSFVINTYDFENGIKKAKEKLYKFK